MVMKMAEQDNLTEVFVHYGGDWPQVGSKEQIREYAELGLTKAALFIRADIAKTEALRSIMADDAMMEMLARGYDAEDAAQRGEPTPWEPGDLDDPHRVEWMEERIACAREGIKRVLAALEDEK